MPNRQKSSIHFTCFKYDFLQKINKHNKNIFVIKNKKYNTTQYKKKIVHGPKSSF